MFSGGINMKLKLFVVVLLAALVLPVVVEANSPTIRIGVTNYDPMPIQPGEFVDVWVSVENIGAGDARDIELSFLDSPYFELVNPDDAVRKINVLGSYKDHVLRYRFRVADDVVEGANNIRFEYTVGNFPGVSGIVNLRVDVKSTEVPVHVSSVRLSPDPVEPGERAELVVAVTNPSLSSNIRDFSVTLQLIDQQSGSLFDLPFAPVDSTNKKSINRILPGQTTEFRFSLVAYPDADSKVYKVPVLFSYFDDVGSRYDSSSFVSINVNSEPDLYAMIESIDLNKNVRRGEVIFDIVNQGISDIKLLTVQLGSTDSLSVISSSHKEYLGGIESDDFKSARFRVSVSDDVDEVVFPLRLTFRDSLNNEFTEEIEVRHVLRTPAEECCNGYLTWIIVLVLIGVFVFYQYRKKQKKKKLLEEEDD